MAKDSTHFQVINPPCLYGRWSVPRLQLSGLKHIERDGASMFIEGETIQVSIEGMDDMVGGGYPWLRAAVLTYAEAEADGSFK